MKANISPEPALLGFLQDGPLHGYDLHKQVRAQLGVVWRLGQSQMYAILKEYETRGWIKTIVAPQTDRPARKMLKLTPQGQRAFDAWMNQSARGLREFRVDFFARLYFAQAAGRRVLRTFLNQQIISTHEELNALPQLGKDSEFAETVSSFRRAQLETILEWLTAYQAAETTRGARHPTGAKKRKNK
ncbi:MAG: PadR family transcriptional regulator [Chloroflexota bacterium]|nr:MAG: PadR family transcriptional regulator [Chloroflexota bacterium]